MALIDEVGTSDLGKRNRVEFTDSRFEKLLELAKLRREDWRYTVYKAVDRYIDDNLHLQKTVVQNGT